jgi:hypothetical protein
MEGGGIDRRGERCGAFPIYACFRAECNQFHPGQEASWLISPAARGSADRGQSFRKAIDRGRSNIVQRETIRAALAHVGMALRNPEEFAVRWHRGEVIYAPPIWASLVLTAMAGTACYGMTMGIGQGLQVVATKSVLLTLAAGLAWAIPLPALYILNSLAGSRLRPSTMLLAALVTTSWGGLALLASIPINWFFSTAIPDLPAIPSLAARLAVMLINLIVFAGVGVSMVDVFGRVVERLEPAGGRKPLWFLALVGLIGSQLFVLFHLFPL